MIAATTLNEDVVERILSNGFLYFSSLRTSTQLMRVTESDRPIDTYNIYSRGTIVRLDSARGGPTAGAGAA